MAPPRSSAPTGPSAAPSFSRRPNVGKRVVLPLVGFAATFAFVSGSLVNPLSGAYASTAAPTDVTAVATGYTVQGQTYTASAGTAVSTTRDAYTVHYTPPVVKKPKPVAAVQATTTATAQSSSATTTTTTVAPVAAAASPGSAQAVGAQLVAARGWGTDQYNCLVSLWNKESGWNVYAANPSGAYGIPQALPGSKMASVGADWQTSASTQITWGLNYIQGRYGTPCGAWAHSVANNWY
ncbi:hypothetical protein GCM10022256_08020 [Frondihabitans peucedani]|uniref:Lytic transglycosylase domain-containing protein n=1 Tax=Frondihabitans peucedani TaxID=598626 RepID=A0ABP8DYY8_9MICO